MKTVKVNAEYLINEMLNKVHKKIIMNDLKDLLEQYKKEEMYHDEIQEMFGSLELVKQSIEFTKQYIKEVNVFTGLERKLMIEILKKLEYLQEIYEDETPF